MAAVESLERAVSRAVAPLEALGARRELRLAAPLAPRSPRSPRRARLAAETATEESPSCGADWGFGWQSYHMD